MQPDICPGQLVVVDQLIDRTYGGSMVVINGARFSTRAESAWFRMMGWDVVNMTGYPEAVLAAELGIRYATVALVTDYDAGVDGHESVSMEAVFAMMQSNVSRVRELLTVAISDIPEILMERP